LSAEPAAPSSTVPILTVEDVYTAYGLSQVLFGVSLEVRPGECVCLLGRNGVGKTTTMRSIIGLTPPTRGRVMWKGQNVAGRAPYQIARAGIGFIPEDRRIFADLTVWENLDVATRGRHEGGWTVERVFDLFPKLRELMGRQGGFLSGGEQQMLTIGRALMTNPDLLILDEATEGLAPLVAREVWRILGDIRRHGMATLIVDKNYAAVTAITDRNVILVKGRVVFEGDTPTLLAQPDLLQRHLGV
jgi:branched-chain amino acid transport system ATP-binding protein